MKKIRLSLCLIVGDAHVGVLARCLKSLLHRSEGPACDELVIGWNGSGAENDTAFIDAVNASLPNEPWGMPTGDNVMVWTSALYGVRVVIYRGVSPVHKGFDVARNESFNHATGEWRGYVDADDVLATATDPAYADSLEQDPPPKVTVDAFPVKGTLPEFVDALPAHVNGVWAPYNYVVSDKGRPIWRKRRPRIVRWDANWLWVNTVHEQLRNALGREVPVWAPGIVLVHQPVQRVEERAARNLPLLQGEINTLQQDNRPLPWSALYGLGAEALQNRNFEAAVQLFSQAVTASQDREERAHASLLAARAALEMDEPNLAGEKALDVIRYTPERPEGYFAAAEAAFAMRKFESCIRWYEAGKDKVVGPMPMVDDRIERCLNPVRHAAVAYLRMNRYAEALEVAKRALKESSDPYAQRVFNVATEGLKYRTLVERTSTLVDGMLDLGFVNAAGRVVALLDGRVPFSERETVRLLQKRVEKKLDAIVVEPIPADTYAAKLLSELETIGVTASVPVDLLDDPKDFIAKLAAKAEAGGAITVVATDPTCADPEVTAQRADGLTAEELFDACAAVGQVKDLALTGVDDRRYLYALTRKGKPTPRTPDVTFFCPVFAEPWGPWRLLHDGVGGSEESVIYLASELAARGLAVDVYAPLDPMRHRGLHIENGVRWRHLDAFDPTKKVAGQTIACRAPWAVRIPAFDPDRLWIWHQDAAYTMGWEPAVAAATRHFFVSQWQKSALLSALGIPTVNTDLTKQGPIGPRSVVIGDAIPRSALDAPFPESRDPFSCVYLSSPVRGLFQLLDLWPQVVERTPLATLKVYYGFESLSGMYSNTPAIQDQTLKRIRKMKGVEWVGRVPQFHLEREITKASIWAYPTMFPEGYCIAGVRAAAAGLIPVYRKTAAMPECQYPSPYAVPESDWLTGGGRLQFEEALHRAFEDAAKNKIDRVEYRRWASGKTWDRVAEAVIAAFERVAGGDKERASA